MKQCKLSVNINKVATLRNARGGDEPNVVDFAIACYKYGASGITIHPRPDQRHITYRDVADLARIFPKSNCEFNIEGYPSDEFLKLAIDARPSQITLVPDPPNVLTSDSGWNTIRDYDLLVDVVHQIQSAGIRVSLFMDTDLELIAKAKAIGADRIELYTGYYASQYHTNRSEIIQSYQAAAREAEALGLGVNAGHDLNLDNIRYLLEAVPEIVEVSIGHALIKECLYYGLQNVISMYHHHLEMARRSMTPTE